MSKTGDIKIIKSDIAMVRRNIKRASNQLANIEHARDYLINDLAKLHKDLWNKENFDKKKG